MIVIEAEGIEDLTSSASAWAVSSSSRMTTACAKLSSFRRLSPVAPHES